MPSGADVHVQHVHLQGEAHNGLSREAAAYNALTENNVQQYPGHERPFDLLVDFYETEKCPFACKNCVQTASAEVQFDMLPVVKSIHDALTAVDRRMILWCNGGEPALVADKLLRYQDTGVYMGMPTTGLFKQDSLLKFILYPNTVRVNISVLGTPDTEGRLRGRAPKGKLDYKRDWIFDIPMDHRWKVSLLYIIYSETLATGEYMSDIEWILQTYPGFQFFVSYDRGDTDLDPVKLNESYNMLHMLRQSMGIQLGANLSYKIGNSRILHPTTFVNGEHFTLNYKNWETFIHYKEVAENPIGFFNEVIGHHNRGTQDAMQNCSVWKQYDCGGPGCRFGHSKGCEDYWLQMIPFQHQVHEIPFI